MTAGGGVSRVLTEAARVGARVGNCTVSARVSAEVCLDVTVRSGNLVSLALSMCTRDIDADAYVMRHALACLLASATATCTQEGSTRTKRELLLRIDRVWVHGCHASWVPFHGKTWAIEAPSSQRLWTVQQLVDGLDACIYRARRALATGCARCGDCVMLGDDALSKATSHQDPRCCLRCVERAASKIGLRARAALVNPRFDLCRRRLLREYDALVQL